MFEMLDKMYKDSLTNEDAPVNRPKVCRDKCSDIKEYKRQYYLKNLLIYRERNRLYREQKKAERYASRKANRNASDDQQEAGV